MKICVYGAGVIGGILASACERAGHDVCVIARGAHLDAIRSRGLVVEAPGYKALATRPRLGPSGGFRRTRRCFDYHENSGADRGRTHDRTAARPAEQQVVFSVNGIFWFYGDSFGEAAGIDCSRLDPDGLLHRTFDLDNVHGLVAWAGGEITEPGVVKASRAKGVFALGSALPGRSAAAEKLVADLAVSELQIDYAPDFNVVMWKKYMQVGRRISRSAR